MGAGSRKGGLGDPAGGMLQNTMTTRGLPEVWLMRFTDDTIQPGFCYQYRIRLKMMNPNYGLKDKVANPGIAQNEELEPGEPVEIEQLVRVPSDDFLYAASEKLQATNTLGPTSVSDKVTLQMHHWFDKLRLETQSRDQPIGEWGVEDVDVLRGNPVSQKKEIVLPLWRMAQTAFMLGESLSFRGKSTGGPRRQEGAVPVELSARPEVLVVDFEGGEGTYRQTTSTGAVKAVTDKATVEVLLTTGDGKVVTARSSAADRNDEDRKKREQDFKDWINQVRQTTMLLKMRNADPLGGGGPPGGNTPSGAGRPGGS